MVQGEVGACTERALVSYRQRAPEAQIILSTYGHCAEHAQGLQAKGLLDVLVISEDPGALPSTVKSPTAGPNNLNRMLVSTQAGLARADRAFVLKIRSDALIDPMRVAHRWAAEGGGGRLLFASRYTRHPFGINGYLFHVSDWITFGRLDRCRHYWAAPLMEHADATVFESTPMTDKATATARRFRARMAQEQWICTHYAKSIGYTVPARIAHRNPLLVRQYVEFLAKECIICDRGTIGLELPKHERSFTSLFQKIDCLSESDWRNIQSTFFSNKRVSAGARLPAYVLRGAVSRLVLLRKRILS